MEVDAKEFELFLDVLDEAGCLGDLIIIGSWAEYIYDKADMLHGFRAGFKTMDADFYIPQLNTKPVEGLRSIASAHGFTMEPDYITGATKFVSKEHFEIEFLTAQNGDGKDQKVKSSIGVTAQPLTHIDILGKYSTFATYDQRAVRVPEPEAYFLHKLIVNGRRGDKAKADREKLKNLFPYINEAKANVMLKTLTGREIKMAGETADIIGVDIISNEINRERGTSVSKIEMTEERIKRLSERIEEHPENPYIEKIKRSKEKEEKKLAKLKNGFKSLDTLMQEAKDTPDPPEEHVHKPHDKTIGDER